MKLGWVGAIAILLVCGCQSNPDGSPVGVADDALKPPVPCLDPENRVMEILSPLDGENIPCGGDMHPYYRVEGLIWPRQVDWEVCDGAVCRPLFVCPEGWICREPPWPPPLPCGRPLVIRVTVTDACGTATHEHTIYVRPLERRTPQHRD